MDVFTVNGWTPIHEASYRGNYPTLARFINFAIEMKKDVLELRTNDTLKVTPLLIAALNGQLECMKYLIKVGSNIEAKFVNKNQVEHGLIEIAFIRQDINILSYLFKLMPNISLRIRNLMNNDKNDENSLASIGRCLEIITQNDESLADENIRLIKEELLRSPEFPRSFSEFLALSVRSEEAFSSCIFIMKNIFGSSKICEAFSASSGIDNLLLIIDLQKRNLIENIKLYRQLISDYDKNKTDKLPNQDCFSLIHASIGHAFCELSCHETFLNIIHKEGYSEFIFNFIRLLFELNHLDNYLKSLLKKDDKEITIKSTSILFEEFIKPYLECIGNLTFKNDLNKKTFNSSGLFEILISYWYKLQYISINLNKDNPKKKQQHLQMLRRDRVLSARSTYSSTTNIDDCIENIKKISYKNEDSIKKYLFYIDESLKNELIDLLRLILIDCMGKALYNNTSLKRNFYVKYELNYKNYLYHVTNTFIDNLIKYLNPFKLVLDKQLRIYILKFISLMCENDLRVINHLICFKEAHRCVLVKYIRDLLHKDIPLDVKEQAMETIWNLCGGTHESSYFYTQNEKWYLHKAIGIKRYLSALYESEYLCLCSIKALKVITRGPPYRHSQTNKLLKYSTDENIVDAIPLLVRALNMTHNEDILLNTLNLINSFCISVGYLTNYESQIYIVRTGILENVMSLITAKSKTFSIILKCNVYYTLSIVSLNNQFARNFIYTNFPRGRTGLIEKILTIFVDDENATMVNNDSDDAIKEKMRIIEHRIRAGRALCAFVYKNEELRNFIIRYFDKLEWSIFKNLLTQLNSFEKFISKSEAHYELVVQREKCYLALQMAALYDIISINNTDEDPRACGIKILLKIIQSSSNSYVRFTASNCICCLVTSDHTLIKAMISIDTIEIICESCLNLNKSSSNVCELEISNASITLAIFIKLNAEARRRILRLARTTPLIIETLKFYNEKLNTDLIMQWNHYQKLLKIGEKPYNFSFSVKTGRMSTNSLNHIKDC